MNNRIDARLEALVEAVRRRRAERALPVDPLSEALTDFQAELASLDAQGKAALLEELNRPSEDGSAGLDLTPEALEQLITSQIRKEKYKCLIC